MKLGKSLYLVMASSLALQGCSPDSFIPGGTNSSEKRELSGTTWYDYGNGLINLSNITRITSSSEIVAEVMPREYFDNKGDFHSEYYGNLSVEEKAIVKAHADYCFDNLRVEGLNERFVFLWPAFRQSASLGAFETKKDGEELAKLISNLKSYITPEFAEFCVVALKGNASIMFDQLSVDLEPYEKYLAFEKNREGKFVKEEIDESFDEMIGDLQEGKTPWHGTYTSLIQK